MDFSKEWEDPANCRCTDRLKPLERRKARQHQRCLAHSLVGTPNYIAPEVLLRTGRVQHPGNILNLMFLEGFHYFWLHITLLVMTYGVLSSPKFVNAMTQEGSCLGL